MSQDRIKQPLMSFIKSAFSRIDYYAFYKCKVVSQSADGTKVDLVPEDSRIPNLSSIPLRLGLPGAVSKFVPGAFVMLGWEGGDPRKPYAEAFNGGETVLELTLKGTQIKIEGTTVTLANGVLAVARQTDTVTGTAGPYPLVSGMIAGGNPNVKA